MPPSLEHAIVNACINLEHCLEKLRMMLTQEGYTINDMREVRRILLSTARDCIDDYACRHMPDKRHY